MSFFASEDAGFITGQRIVVDGGRGLTPDHWHPVPYPRHG